jgi:3-oxoacyl-(acyl-carrier-protein) synthase
MRAPAIRAVGLLSGWGRGAAAVPADAARAAAGRAVLSLERPALDPERFRRSRRECLLGVAAVGAMLEDAGVGADAIAGERTALLFATAAAYAASNREFIEARVGGVYFPYTPAAAVPAEVAIEFGLTGPYEILIGGPTATMRAVALAAALLESGACDRALVLAVEIFEECADLFARARGRLARPLVEAAGCLWLEPGEGTLSFDQRRGGRRETGGARQRLGEMLACEPVAALALARDGGATGPLRLQGAWRGESARLAWSQSPYQMRGAARPRRRRIA